MRLELLGWRCVGLRCADMDIKLDVQGQLPRVSLIQMPNGTGKTTTLTCLRATLSGEASKWSAEEIRQLAPRESANDTGEFSVRLSLDDRPVTFSLTFDFSAGKAQYATTFDTGRNPRYAPPPELQRFLTDHFLRLLIFDGELPQQLLDRGATKAEQALETFFQTYLLDGLSDAIGRLWQSATTGKTALETRGLARRRNRVDSLRKGLARLEREKDEALERRETLLQGLEDLRAKKRRYVQLTAELREEHEMLEKKERSASALLSSELRTLMERVRRPHRVLPAFGTSLTTLRDQLDRLRLPETTSAQFFDELAQEPLCVCGRPLDNAARRVIQERAAQYMGVDAYGVINRLKVEITLKSAGTVERSTEELGAAVKDVGHRRDGARSRMNELSRRLAEEGNDDLRRVQDELDEKEQELRNVDDLLHELTRDRLPTDDKQCRCIAWWKHEFEKADKRLAEITDTLALRRHRDILLKILENAKATASARIAKSVVLEMNRNLDMLLPSHGIRVAGIERSLVLDRQAGASQGQTLAVGYSFLTTLFRRGQHQFPFLVDAPVIALDGRVRKEVAQIIPAVCPQFVALVLDTEREGFVEDLSTAAEDDVLFLTVFEDLQTNSHLVDSLPSEGVTREGGSVVVIGRDYFESVSFPADS